KSFVSPHPKPLSPQGRGIGRGARKKRLKRLALRLRLRRVPAAVPAHPAPDHHAAPVATLAATTTASRVEPLGDAAELGAPRHVLAEALLRFAGDADALPPRLLAEPGDAAGRRPFLLLGRRAHVDLRQG